MSKRDIKESNTEARSCPRISAAQEQVLRGAAAHPGGFVPGELWESKRRTLPRTIEALMRLDLLRAAGEAAHPKPDTNPTQQHRITAAGLRAIGAPDVLVGARPVLPEETGEVPRPELPPSLPAGSTKADVIVSLLKRPEGASIGELSSAVSWQAHSVRGFLSGTVKRRMGLEVRSAHGADGVRRYSLAQA